MSTTQHHQDVPPRSQWPEPAVRTEAGAALSDVIMATFRLNSRLMEAAAGLADQGGLTAAWWQVLGGVVDQPRSVADIGRNMGMTRQGVQRVADLLVDHGLAEYRPNPAHRRAKLLACTEPGYWAIRQIALVQHSWVNNIAAHLGADELHHTYTTMTRLITALDADQTTDHSVSIQ